MMKTDQIKELLLQYCCFSCGQPLSRNDRGLDGERRICSKCIAELQAEERRLDAEAKEFFEHLSLEHRKPRWLNILLTKLMDLFVRKRIAPSK